MITHIDQLDLSKRYTYSDYLTWRFGEAVELIRGRLYKMSPAPSKGHQEISGNLHGAIWTYLKGKPCKVFSAPFDVRLLLPKEQRTDDSIDTVVQPDLCVICDRKKLDDRGCLGAPDWVIEILSKSTSKKDLIDKFDLYQNAGVKEYWIVDPTNETVIPYICDAEGRFQLIRRRPFVKGELVPVGVFPDFSIRLEEVFVNDDF